MNFYNLKQLLLWTLTGWLFAQLQQLTDRGGFCGITRLHHVSNFRLREAIAPSSRVPCVFWRREPETFLLFMNRLLCGGTARSSGFGIESEQYLRVCACFVHLCLRMCVCKLWLFVSSSGCGNVCLICMNVPLCAAARVGCERVYTKSQGFVCW